MSRSCSVLSPMAPGTSFTETKSIASPLPVNADPRRKLGRFAQRFTQGWMRMDVGADFPRRRFHEPRQRGLLDQLRGVVPDDVRTQQVAAVRVEDDLGEPVRLVLDNGHGVVAEVES